MKKNIPFNLPDESEEYEQALKVGKYYTAISDYAQLLQEVMKSDNKEAPHAKWAYDKLIEELQEHKLIELFDVR